MKSWRSCKTDPPPKGQHCLVWSPQWKPYTAFAEYYDLENAWYDRIEGVPEDQRERFRKEEKDAVGFFDSFGTKENFNLNNLFWMPVPCGPVKDEE